MGVAPGEAPAAGAAVGTSQRPITWSPRPRPGTSREAARTAQPPTPAAAPSTADEMITVRRETPTGADGSRRSVGTQPPTAGYHEPVRIGGRRRGYGSPYSGNPSATKGRS